MSCEYCIEHISHTEACTKYGGAGQCDWDCKYYDESINLGVPKCCLKENRIKQHSFCWNCGALLIPPRALTNADYFRNMSDEEMSKMCLREFGTLREPTRYGGGKHTFFCPSGKKMPREDALNKWLEWLQRNAKAWSGDPVKGILLAFRDNVHNEPDCVIIPVDETGTPDFTEDGYVEIGVDPATIEPVRVRPIDTEDYEICSNCKSPNISFMRTNDYGQPPEPFQCDFCPDCGMALSWDLLDKGGGGEVDGYRCFADDKYNLCGKD